MHDKLAALGYAGSERTTRRVVAEVKSAYRSGRRRAHRPWIPEPGCGSNTTSVAVPAWMVLVRSCFARGWRGAGFRVVLALLDKTLPSVMAAIDQALRIFGGVPTYGLTDNEKTVTVEHVDESTLVRSHCRFTNRG